MGPGGPGGLWLYPEKGRSHGGCEQRRDVVAPAFLKPLSWCSMEKRSQGVRVEPSRLAGRITRAVGDSRPNLNEGMRVHDEEFKTPQHGTWHTVGPQETAAVMISIWQMLQNPK